MCKIEKNELRRTGLLIREKAFEKHKNSRFSNNLVLNFQQWICKTKNIGRIALYYPINSEFDTFQLMKTLFFDGKEICLPVVVKKDFPLRFREWTPETYMTKSSFNIPIPVTDKEVLPDLVICPLISYDKRGVRLGYGGGFYDRYIKKIKKRKKVTIIGLAYSFQKVKKIPINRYDIKLDFVITEKHS